MPYQLGDTPKAIFKICELLPLFTLPKQSGRGSWTRTNGCQDQNLMPYQLGDTPILGRYYSKNLSLCKGFFNFCAKNL